MGNIYFLFVMSDSSNSIPIKDQLFLARSSGACLDKRSSKAGALTSTVNGVRLFIREYNLYYKT